MYETKLCIISVSASTARGSLDCFLPAEGRSDLVSNSRNCIKFKLNEISNLILIPGKLAKGQGLHSRLIYFLGVKQ